MYALREMFIVELNCTNRALSDGEVFHNRTSQVCALLPVAQFERELHGPVCNDVGSLPLKVCLIRLLRSVKSLLL